MIRPFYSFSDSRDSEVFNQLLDNHNALLQTLMLVQLGKNLMCACRLHYNFINQKKLNTSVFDQYIKFTTCTNHMDESTALRYTVTLPELHKFSQ